MPKKHGTENELFVPRDVEELITALQTDGEKEFAKYLGAKKREQFEDDIVLNSVGGNTYRAFPCKGGEHPKRVFEDWAEKQIDPSRKTVRGIDLNSQSAFDSWNVKFCNHFRRFWDQRMVDNITYGPSRKMPNLLLKRLLLWENVEKDSGKKLLSFLHVAWDKFTLQGLRLCASEFGIPNSASMKFVNTPEKYEALLYWTRKVANKANVPPIYLDILFWNKSHPRAN